MPIKFLILVNKQGQTRLAKYYDWMTVAERIALESELIRKCLSRTELQCSFMTFRQYQVVYRRYASLYFIVGQNADDDDVNELALLEFIHNLVETMEQSVRGIIAYSQCSQVFVQ